MWKEPSNLCIIIFVTFRHLSNPMPFFTSILISVVMLLQIMSSVSSAVLKIALYMPRCLPDGEVVVPSLHIRNSCLRSSTEIWSEISGLACRLVCRTCWIRLSSDMVVSRMVPFSI